VARTISTRVRGEQDLRALTREVRDHVARGANVMVVYPVVRSQAESEEGQSAERPQKRSLRDAIDRWERLFPGKVRDMTGDTADARQAEILRELATGDAQVLTCSTVAECGVNIPRLRKCVIVDAERFGLAQLHQIRGRLAREGGVGECDLIVGAALSDTARIRIERFMACRTGDDIAAADLELRGCGDLSERGDDQSGHAIDGLAQASPFAIALTGPGLANAIARVRGAEAA
jgi:ATP-dependent DNA helicase RecG